MGCSAAKGEREKKFQAKFTFYRGFLFSVLFVAVAADKMYNNYHVAKEWVGLKRKKNSQTLAEMTCL